MNVNPIAALEPDLLEAVAINCTTCWKAANPLPSASAIHLIDDYRWRLRHQFTLEQEVAELAWDGCYEGTLDDLRYAAHCEIYAKSGDRADLVKMLRHVR